MGSFPLWRQCYVACLRSVLRRSYLEEGYDVFDQPYMVQRFERQGDCYLSAVAVKPILDYRFQPRGEDYCPVWRMAENKK